MGPTRSRSRGIEVAMDVLVTGGAGFIGSHLTEALVGLGHSVIVLDNLSTGRAEKLPKECSLVVGDIRDRSCVEGCIRPVDVVFHLAAFTSVPGGEERPDECFDVNVNGTRILLEIASLYKVKRFVFSSSSAVYPDSADTPLSEIATAVPQSQYGRSKLDGESLVQWFHQHSGLSYAGLRYFNVYGPRQDVQSNYAAVIPAFISTSCKHEALTIYGDGEQTRDFVYVADVVRANLVALQSEVCGIFNVGTSKATSIHDLARTVIRLTGSKSTYIFEPIRAGDALHSTADISLISSRLGWNSRWDLSAGLQETISWFDVKESVKS